MRVRWYGHACFLVDEGGCRVLIDPLPETAPAQPGLRFAYPPVDDAAPHVVLVTHDHWDHSGFLRFEGSARLVRDLGRHSTPEIRVHAIPADHDADGGRLRGRVLLMVWKQGPWRLCHLSDLGQPDLTAAQREAIGRPDVLFVPVGGGPTIDGIAASRLVRELQPRHVFPMHYRTPAVNFLDRVDVFVAAVRARAEVQRAASPEVTLDLHASHAMPRVHVLPAPLGRQGETPDVRSPAHNEEGAARRRPLLER